MVYKGSGGPPPSTVRGKGGGDFRSKGTYGFGLFEKLKSGKMKKVPTFRVDPGEQNVPFLFLDEALPSDGSSPSVRMHEAFRYKGTYGNRVICNHHRDNGCLMDCALEAEHRCWPNCDDPCPKKGTKEPVKGGWRWVATGIKMKPFTYEKGPLEGTTVPFQRCLLLVPEKQYNQFLAFRKAYAKMGGLRGKIFHVSRPDDKTSSKIGVEWDPAGEMTDEEMLAKFDKAANDYGLSTEDYCRPYDYAFVLKEFSDEEMEKAARSVAEDRGIDLSKYLKTGGRADEGSSELPGDEGDEQDMEF